MTNVYDRLLKTKVIKMKNKAAVSLGKESWKARLKAHKGNASKIMSEVRRKGIQAKLDKRSEIISNDNTA